MSVQPRHTHWYKFVNMDAHYSKCKCCRCLSNSMVPIRRKCGINEDDQLLANSDQPVPGKVEFILKLNF